MSISNVYIKDSDAILDYGFDWSQWLSEGEIISSASIALSASTITVPSTTITAGSVIAWLSGGDLGTRYSVTCHIQTDQNRVDERTIKIDVRER